jgi:hypothetical protein
MNSNTPVILNTLETQLNQRLEKLWRVFNWCSSILISIIAAVLFANHAGNIILHWQECIIISLVILILSVYAYLWIKENLIYEGKIRNEIDKLFETEFACNVLKDLRPDKAKFGYKVVIILLAAAALLATWMNVFYK